MTCQTKFFHYFHGNFLTSCFYFMGKTTTESVPLTFFAFQHQNSCLISLKAICTVKYWHCWLCTTIHTWILSGDITRFYEHSIILPKVKCIYRRQDKVLLTISSWKSTLELTRKAACHLLFIKLFSPIQSLFYFCFFSDF